MSLSKTILVFVITTSQVLISGNVICWAKQGNLREETFKEMKIEVRAVNSKTDRLIESIRTIRNSGKSLKDWKDSKSENILDDFEPLLNDQNRAIFQAMDLRESIAKIQNGLDYLAQSHWELISVENGEYYFKRLKDN